MSGTTPESGCAIASEGVIEVRGLSKRFGNIVAVDDLSFDVQRGSVAALLGGNGAGKTTTLAMLLGLLTPSSGSIRVLGWDMSRRRHQALRRMNYSSPYIDLPQRLTVCQNLGVYARLYGLPDPNRRIQELAEQLALSEFVDRPYGSLSSGQRTRVCLAKALLNRPEVLLLDEPTASLDPDSGDRMRALLSEYRKISGATLLIASHNMPEVERLCDFVFMMHKGRLVDRGRPQDLIARYGRDSMEEVFLDVVRNGS